MADVNEVEQLRRELRSEILQATEAWEQQLADLRAELKSEVEWQLADRSLIARAARAVRAAWQELR